MLACQGKRPGKGNGGLPRSLTLDASRGKPSPAARYSLLHSLNMYLLRDRKKFADEFDSL
jgi:hypothetical protein